MQRARYIQRIAQHLGMRDWTINLQHEPPQGNDRVAGDEANAECWVPDGHKIASMRFHEDSWHRSKEDIRGTVVHELLHARIWALMEQVKSIRNHITEPAFDVWSSAIDRLEESLVDDLARSAVMDGLPLPPFGRKPDVPHPVAP
jgi:hypothetical protein